MATNPTPLDDGLLCALAEDLADGCKLHEVPIGIKQNTEASIRSAIVAVSEGKLALGGARGALGRLYRTLQARDAAGKVVLRNCRLRLVKLFGNRFNEGWGQAGFPNHSTAVPESQDERFTLLGALKAYFAGNPSAESPEMEATAAICDAMHESVSDARQGVNSGERAVTDAKKNEARAVRMLRKRVRGLINELGQLVEADDSRYEAFGLNIPARPTAPKQITKFAAVAQGGGSVHASWSYSTRMAGTRIVGRRVGVDESRHSLGTADGLEKTLQGLEPGEWELFAVAYNDGGDAPESPPVLLLVT